MTAIEDLPTSAAPGAGDAPPDERWEEGAQFALARVAGHTLAVNIGQASQIIERPPITPVPNTPSFILGVCNVRGDIYSIVDIRPLLGLPASDPTAGADRLVILLEGSQYACGAVVEEVKEIVRIPDALIAPPAGESEMPHVAGLVRRGQETILVLDVDGLLASPEMTQFR